MTEFLKIGNNIIAKPKGTDYDLINGKVYDSKAMAKRQEELIEDFLSPFEVAEDAYVIEDTEKSE